MPKMKRRVSISCSRSIELDDIRRLLFFRSSCFALRCALEFFQRISRRAEPTVDFGLHFFVDRLYLKASQLRRDLHRQPAQLIGERVQELATFTYNFECDRLQ